MVIWRRSDMRDGTGIQFIVWENDRMRGESIDGTEIWSMESVSAAQRDSMMNSNSFWSITDMLGYAQRMEEGSRCNT